MQHVLADHTALAPGVSWRLAEPGRQLDANVLNLAAGHIIETHAEPDLDVLVVVLSGTGCVETDGATLTLTAGELLWLPRGSTRKLAAGAHGLAYLTVHRRRPGLQIRSGPPSFG
ncbi:cupin domain-containing protein [Pseudonocardia sp. RS11V-5]|uniref:cupin domain-containing protein n=1 Tax=Pseudonocardia terrae TaxID=2905831 RepID=UPI001E654764|nr:cupin domain-containing protein [Pseudonocardia terrae]MCE3556075.1 cupin domain-containing protein [Pseudonocardia terrae]